MLLIIVDVDGKSYFAFGLNVELLEADVDGSQYSLDPAVASVANRLEQIVDESEDANLQQLRFIKRIIFVPLIKML